ncbi:MAG: gamma-butyrobetaine hydroxylase-like domain-containing protein [Pseudomonadota bacterium]
MKSPAPSELRYHRDRHELTLAWGEERHVLSAEFLRVHSPSAEVQGHGGEGGTLPVGKAAVAIVGIEPVGNYAVKIRFSDGHDTGLYSWDWLHELCMNRERLQEEYRHKVAALPPTAGSAPTAAAIRFTPSK